MEGKTVCRAKIYGKDLHQKGEGKSLRRMHAMHLSPSPAISERRMREEIHRFRPFMGNKLKIHRRRLANMTSGILVSRSVRSTFARLCLVPMQNGTSSIHHDTPLLVRIQFFDQIPELRSYCRRAFKLGDWIQLCHDDDWREVPVNPDKITNWKQPRCVLDVSSPEMAQQHFQVMQSQYWSLTQCQEWQNHHLPTKLEKASTMMMMSVNTNATTRNNNKASIQNGGDNNTEQTAESKDTNNPHGGKTEKRVHGEHVARFLIAMMANQHRTAGTAISSSTDNWLGDPSKWSAWCWDGSNSTTFQKSPLYQQAIESLNAGSGVLDVAGGSGHVSMALGLLGVHSTVVDARESVGKLPGRYRKIWNRALKQQKQQQPGDDEYCRPVVVPYQSFRGWFGERPAGVDATFRHPDQDELPVCNETSDLFRRASAIVALHPDEATGDVVRLAAAYNKPLVVVPCCVFARLFPDRRVNEDGNNNGCGSKSVSTYDDLLQFLKNYDASIQQTELPFDGKNTVLWSTFHDGTTL